LSREADGRPLRAVGYLVALQADRVTLPLTVRTRRPGDRIRPIGAPGTRKLQDLFVDRKIPASERGRVPIVEDASGQIVWVAGVAVAERARVTRPEAGMVILELKKDEA
jgi:tRNA(Ile)-lysidine synthetase-like protein